MPCLLILEWILIEKISFNIKKKKYKIVSTINWQAFFPFNTNSLCKLRQYFSPCFLYLSFIFNFNFRVLLAVWKVPFSITIFQRFYWEAAKKLFSLWPDHYAGRGGGIKKCSGYFKTKNKNETKKGSGGFKLGSVGGGGYGLKGLAIIKFFFAASYICFAGIIQRLASNVADYSDF